MPKYYPKKAKRAGGWKRKRGGYGKYRKSSYPKKSKKAYRAWHITRRVMPTIWPDKVLVKFKSSGIWEPDTDIITGGTTFGIVANSIFDPFGTFSSTEQPTGFDQWAGFYNRYFVNACKVTIHIYAPPNATNTQDGVYAIWPSANAVFAESSFASRNMFEIQNVRWKQAQRTLSVPLRLTHYATTHKISGGHLSDTVDNAIGIIATSGGTSPGEPWYMNVRFYNLFEPTTLLSGRAMITVTQYATLFRRVDITDSTQ